MPFWRKFMVDARTNHASKNQHVLPKAMARGAATFRAANSSSPKDLKRRRILFKHLQI